MSSEDSRVHSGEAVATLAHKHWFSDNFIIYLFV